jgi:hypothetical protein
VALENLAATLWAFKRAANQNVNCSLVKRIRESRQAVGPVKKLRHGLAALKGHNVMRSDLLWTSFRRAALQQGSLNQGHLLLSGYKPWGHVIGVIVDK